MKNVIRNDKGSVMVYVTIIMFVLLGATALAIDGGTLYLTKSRLQNAVDAAALAGASQLLEDPDGEEAQKRAAAYLANNQVELPDGYGGSLNGGNTPITLSEGSDVVTLDVGEWLVTSLDSYYSQIRVTVAREVPLGFARIFGHGNTRTVTATAVAELVPATAFIGATPIGIEEEAFVYGQEYILHHAPGEGFTGNFGWLALGGTGSSILLKNLETPYQDPVGTSDNDVFAEDIFSEPGGNGKPLADAMQAKIDACLENCPIECTVDNFDPDCPRLLLITVIDKWPPGRSDPVNIKGFAYFFLDDNNGQPITQGNEFEVNGQFVKWYGTGTGSADQEDYGAKVVNLVE